VGFPHDRIQGTNWLAADNCLATWLFDLEHNHFYQPSSQVLGDKLLTRIWFNKKFLIPREITPEKIKELKRDFIKAIKLAVALGFNMMEVYTVYGYYIRFYYQLYVSNVLALLFPLIYKFKKDDKLLLDYSPLVKA